jgi:hypothetical protein
MIEAPHLVWNARDWLVPALAIAGVLLALVLFGYWRVNNPVLRYGAALLKLIAVALLTMCLLEPLFAGKKVRPGANQFAVLVDDSQSMTLKDAGAAMTRGEQFARVGGEDAKWLDMIAQNFDLREFSFDSQLKSVEGFKGLKFDGRASNLGKSLESLLQRYQGRPLAGILLFTDGSTTDPDAVMRVLAQAAKTDAASKVPPIYPVVMGRRGPDKDVSVERITVSQTNFEDSPVTLAAQLNTTGMAGRNIVAELLDSAGKKIEEQQLRISQDGEPVVARFRIRPDDKETQGLSFYTVRASEQGRQLQFLNPESTDEATLANNSRLAAVDRGKGPYRVLYVGGRMSWEFKFLNRAVSTDDQVQLVGLIRIAKREPKFNFIGRVATGETVNPIFSGFENVNPEDTNYDQPVIGRVGVKDQTELNAGFPKTPEELFAYQAVIIDDMEAEFFSQDQMQMLKDFVRVRGGAMMMMGGVETFKAGKYDRTVIGDMLPVYIDDSPTLKGEAFSMALTREGWLEPSLRLRSDEATEQMRLDSMGDVFQVVTATRGIKPGATVLARARSENGDFVPALIEQRFGKGRVIALTIGDLWRWAMHRPTPTDSDFEKAWRQQIRYMVADVAQRIDVAIDNKQRAEDPDGTVRLIIQARDAAFQPLDNATVSVKVTAPGVAGSETKEVEMRADPSEKTPGQYEVMYVSRQPGSYKAAISVVGMDGVGIGEARAGWTSDPAAEEFRMLQPDATLLERIAKTTGGEVIELSDLERFATNLPQRQAQVMESYTQPFWHQSWIFLLAIALLASEWALRRWRGLP